MRALVTGGTGFVGSHIARQLNENGDDVRVLHRTTSKRDALSGVEYESAIGDVTDAESLRAACDGVDVVFHVAAVADYWRADKTRMFQVNAVGTANVLKAAREAGVQRVIFTSSAAAVGFPYGDQLADERVPFNLSPERFPYGYSKYLAEKVIAEAVAQGQDVVTLNPTVIMGPGDLNLISGSFIMQMKRFQWLTPLTSGGIAVIDVRDVARLHLSAVENGRSGERYVLNTANFTYEEWFGMIAAVLDIPPPRYQVPDFLLSPMAAAVDFLRGLGVNTPVDANQIRLGARKVFFDASKMRAELGEPQIDMQTSLRDTYAWYRQHGYATDDTLAAAIRWLGGLVRR